MAFLFCGRFLSPLRSGLVTYCHVQVTFRLNTDGPGFFTFNEYNKTYENITLQTARKNNGKNEEALAAGAVTA